MTTSITATAVGDATGEQPAPVRRHRGWRRWRPVVLPVVGFVLALVLLSPYIVMLLDALRPSADVVATPTTFLPRHWRFSSFGDVLSDDRFLNWLKTSLLVAGVSTAIVLVAAVPAAYFTARYRFPGRTLFLFLVLVTQMFSPTSLVVGIYREFFDLSLVNTYQAIILTNAAFNLAFAVWILHGFFSAVPKDVEDAAHLDGCSKFGTLWRVMLPLTKPGLVTAVVFTFIAAWNEYVVALTLMQDDSRKPLTVGINSYVTGYQQNWDLLFAASIIAIVPVVVLFAAIEKHLVGGLTAGSVK
ncbi:carbohydrate ABC transporter membrane protein 2, CUT1 family [Jatrophihabitans endophyticus]|uniref:Carbohydrate ABC transporter membrane protein 2, CUT1 family n=1 Tax=Jatrophihabitans endophyticus TaxID=1206085 RepID=A0A1M5HEH8_9ACTN|nr:carbohydrate ABC transporter permease [Jatrophihabitans endophyticus]SHG14360.1 carbohydrate ABC transporter membrane protein 2, CUT1 family [Jatrophihabitans endophyticus]